MERKLHVFCANLLCYTVEERLVCVIICDMCIKKTTLDQAGSMNVSDMKRQSSLLQYTKSNMALGHGKYSAINRSIALMCAVDMRPISIVNGNGFKNMCSELNAQYSVPAASTISKYVDILYKETKDTVLAELTGSVAALTTDMWTSMTSKGYITITCHHISPEWKLVNRVLATRGTDDRHTGENIARHLKNVEQEFHIGQVTALVTDNASNMVTAGALGGYTRLGCFSHSLQLCINDGMKQPTVAKAVATAKRVVGHFSHSNVATQALSDHQIKMGCNGKPLQLIQDVVTRWNSVYLMIRRLLKLRVSVYGVLFDEKVTKPGDRASFELKDSTWKVLEDLLPLLEPLAEATQLLTSETLPTCSSVLVILATLLPPLGHVDLDSVAIREVKDKIRTNMMKRFHVDENGDPDDNILSEIYAVSALLDPRSKSLKFMSSNKREKIQDHLVAILEQNRQIEQSGAVVHTNTDSEPISIKIEDIEEHVPAAKKRLIDCLSPDVVDLTVGDQSTTIERELEGYITEPVHVTDPLAWWKVNHTRFPNIAQVARRYLCIPATEVPSERSFSAASGTVTKRRATLDPDTVDQLTFVHKNYVFVERIPLGGNVAAGTLINPAATSSSTTAPTIRQPATEPVIQRSVIVNQLKLNQPNQHQHSRL